MSVLLAVILDTRRMKKKTGKFPLKLRVTYERTPQYYTTTYELTEEDYNKLSASRISITLQDIRERIQEIERTSSEIAKNLDPFAFAEFEKDYILNNKHFQQKKLKPAQLKTDTEDFDFTPYVKKFSILNDDHSRLGTISVTYLSYIKKLIQEKRIGTAVSYHCSYQSLKKYKGNVRFIEITPTFLRQYEEWAKEQGIAKATIGIYLRSLRAIFNEAIADGIIKREKYYPFGRRKYQIPTGRNIKKALSIDHIREIYYYEPKCESEGRARDYWLLCYLCNGVNPKDVALLKYKNLDEGYIIFERAKTERTARTDPKQITIYINEEIAALIKRLGNTDTSPNNYIFPVLYEGVTPLEQYDLIEYFVRFINDWMAKICKSLGIEKKATTIVSRHSFSTVMKNAGASTEFIQEALGHMDKRTTENYLGSFEKEIKKEFSTKLLSFKKAEISEIAKLEKLVDLSN